MKSKYNIEPIINCILCILAFLLGLGFLGGSNYLFLAIGLICAVRSIVKRRLIISHNLLWIVFLCIFSLFSIFIFQGFSLNYLVQFVAIPIFAYFVFCDLRSKPNVNSNNSKFFNRFFLCLLLGTLTEIILFYICSVRELGFDLSTRTVANPWYYLGVSKTHFLTGTVLSLPCTLIILFGLSLIIKKNRPLLSVLFIISSIFVIYFSIKMQNRGFFVAFVGALVVLALYSDNIFKKRISVDVLTTIAILVLGISLFLVIITEFFPKSSIVDFLSNIPILKRFLNRGTDSKRLGHYKEFFSLFYKYPFGGLNKHVSYAYVHNTVLDVYNVVGLIPTLVIGFFYVRFFIDYYKVCVHSKQFENRYSILFPFFIAIPFLILSLIEPVWDGTPALFGTILVLILATNQHSVELNNKYKFVKKIDIDNAKVVFINKSLINHVSPLHEKLVNKYKERYTCITYEDL